jgi:hypothetical protein
LTKIKEFKLQLSEREDAVIFLKDFDNQVAKLRQSGFNKALDPDHLFKSFLLAALPASFESLIGGIVNDLESETYEGVYNKILNKSVLASSTTIHPTADFISAEKKMCPACKRIHFGPCALECPKSKKKHCGHYKCNITEKNNLNKEISTYSIFGTLILVSMFLYQTLLVISGLSHLQKGILVLLVNTEDYLLMVLEVYL